MSVSHIREATIKRVSDADCLWFEQHPGRLFRMRDEVPFEFNAPPQPMPEGTSGRVIVASIPHIGVRLRLPVGASDCIGNDEISDSTLREMFLGLAPPEVLGLYKLAIVPPR